MDNIDLLTGFGTSDVTHYSEEQLASNWLQWMCFSDDGGQNICPIIFQVCAVLSRTVSKGFFYSDGSMILYSLNAVDCWGNILSGTPAYKVCFILTASETMMQMQNYILNLKGE